jgi:hypothetical protein
MVPVKSTSHIDFSGPFFTNDPGQTFRQNARRMERAMALEGEADVKQQMDAGAAGRAVISRGVNPERVSGHVRAAIPYSPGGKSKLNAAILVNVYVENRGFTGRQGQALMAAFSQVERETGAFRKTANRLKRSRAANVAELLKDIA